MTRALLAQYRSALAAYENARAALDARHDAESLSTDESNDADDRLHEECFEPFCQARGLLLSAVCLEHGMDPRERIPRPIATRIDDILIIVAPGWDDPATTQIHVVEPADVATTPGRETLQLLANLRFTVTADGWPRDIEFDVFKQDRKSWDEFASTRRAAQWAGVELDDGHVLAARLHLPDAEPPMQGMPKPDEPERIEATRAMRRRVLDWLETEIGDVDASLTGNGGCAANITVNGEPLTLTLEPNFYM